MFKDLRRNKQALPESEIERILKDNTSGVLAINGEYAYGVPLSYIYDGEAIYFHVARSGHKLDLIKENPKVSFSIIDKDEVIEERFTTFYKSVIVFGEIEIIDDIELKKEALYKLVNKYSYSVSSDKKVEEIESGINRLYILKLNIKHISAKAAIELMRT